MQADAARLFEQLIASGVLRANESPVEAREKCRKKSA
jgi:hypothetical protein